VLLIFISLAFVMGATLWYLGGCNDGKGKAWKSKVAEEEEGWGGEGREWNEGGKEEGGGGRSTADLEASIASLEASIASVGAKRHGLRTNDLEKQHCIAPALRRPMLTMTTRRFGDYRKAETREWRMK
jgi:hypothetical protein